METSLPVQNICNAAAWLRRCVGNSEWWVIALPNDEEVSNVFNSIFRCKYYVGKASADYHNICTPWMRLVFAKQKWIPKEDFVCLLAMEFGNLLELDRSNAKNIVICPPPTGDTASFLIELITDLLIFGQPSRYLWPSCQIVSSRCNEQLADGYRWN